MSESPEPQNIYDPAFVADLFDRCSGAYRWWSQVSSFGFITRWRKLCVRLVGPVPKEAVVFDLMAGTGEVWPHWFQAHPDTAKVVAMDISPKMHEHAMQRLHQERTDKVEHLCANVLTQDFVDGQADVVISTFGLKTFDRAQQALLAQQVARLLKQGGRFALIEASDPKGWVLRPLYRFYLDRVLPRVEAVFLKGAQDFSMIGAYTRQFEDCSGFLTDLRDAGLEAHLHRDFFGCATAVHGVKYRP